MTMNLRTSAGLDHQDVTLTKTLVSMKTTVVGDQQEKIANSSQLRTKTKIDKPNTPRQVEVAGERTRKANIQEASKALIELRRATQSGNVKGTVTKAQSAQHLTTTPEIVLVTHGGINQAWWEKPLEETKITTASLKLDSEKVQESGLLPMLPLFSPLSHSPSLCEN